MLEIVLTSSESDQYSSPPKDISKFPLMYMTGYFCRSVYIYEPIRTDNILDTYTFVLTMAVSVYRNGFIADLIGKTNTAVHAYTTVGIVCPERAKIPLKMN